MNEMEKDFAEGAAAIAKITDVIVDQIRKLGELHEDGILTDKEFASKKQELL